MKKMLALSMAAALLAVLPQPAFAWKHFKFGVGLNLEAASGNNSWRHFRNGPVEGHGGHGGHGHHDPFGGFGGYGPGPMPFSYAEPPMATPPSAKDSGTATAQPAFYTNPYQVQPANYALPYYQPQMPYYAAPGYWYGY